MNTYSGKTFSEMSAFEKIDYLESIRNPISTAYYMTYILDRWRELENMIANKPVTGSYICHSCEGFKDDLKKLSAYVEKLERVRNVAIDLISGFVQLKTSKASHLGRLKDALAVLEEKE